MGTELDNRKGIAETIGNIKDSEALGILAAVAAKRSTNVCKYLCKELKRQGGEKEGEDAMFDHRIRMLRFHYGGFWKNTRKLVFDGFDAFEYDGGKYIDVEWDVDYVNIMDLNSHLSEETRFTRPRKLEHELIYLYFMSGGSSRYRIDTDKDLLSWWEVSKPDNDGISHLYAEFIEWGDPLPVDEGASSGLNVRMHVLGDKSKTNTHDGGDPRSFCSGDAHGRDKVGEDDCEEVVLEGYTRMIQSILSQGINVNASSDLGTPIHLAAQSCKQYVKTFVDHGANEQIFEEVDKVTERWGDQVAEHEAQVTSQGQKKYKKDSDLLQETLPVTSSQAQEPDLNVKSKDESSDLSKKFTTDQTFESREDLIHWAKDTGKKCGTVVVITKSDKPTSRRPARFHLSCEWHKNAVRKMHAKRLTGYCPFQLRGIYTCNSNDKWKVKVHCGRHNHQLANNSSITLSSLPRERVQVKSRQIGCRKNISQSNQLKKREPSAVEYTQPSKSQSVTLGKQKPQPTKKLKLASTRKGLCDISTDHFWEIIRPFIDNVHNVDFDGQCGFRAVAAGLGLNSERGWLTVREELIVELNCFKDEYMKIYGGEAYIEQLLDVLGCTTSPCPTKYWFTLPKMGHLVASRYQVVFVCISHVDALTFVPLRSHPPTDEPKVIAIGNVDRVHFVPIKLKPGCPIPQPVKIWVDRKLCEGWGDLLKNRTDAFKALADHQPSNQETAEVDVIILD